MRKQRIEQGRRRSRQGKCGESHSRIALGHPTIKSDIQPSKAATKGFISPFDQVKHDPSTLSHGKHLQMIIPRRRPLQLRSAMNGTFFV